MAAGELLNHAREAAVEGTAAGEAIEAALSRLAERYYDARRHRFDYGAAAVSEEYDHLRRAVAGLAGMDPGEMTDPARAEAFWINVYNSLALHIILTGSIGASVREREDFFTGPHYCIGGQEMPLDVIEHGILRGNARKYMGLKPQLPRGDPRLAWTLTRPDPRVHFLLYTGSVSSPRLRTVPMDTVDETLEAAVREHLDATVSVSTTGEQVRLPRLFRWYTGDFGGSVDDALAFVRARLGDERADALAREDIDVAFTPFDWRLNDRYARLD